MKAQATANGAGERPGQDAGATEEDVRARKAAVQALIIAESKHETVEEEYSGRPCATC